MMSSGRNRPASPHACFSPFVLGFPKYAGPVCSLRALITTQGTPRALWATEASKEMSTTPRFFTQALWYTISKSIFRSLWFAVSNCSLELFLLLPLAKHPLKVSDHETHINWNLCFLLGYLGKIQQRQWGKHNANFYSWFHNTTLIIFRLNLVHNN